MNWLLALMPPWWKLAAAGMVLVALTGAAWKFRHGGVVAGRAEIQAEWDIEKTALAELARRSLAEKTKANERIDHEQQTFKKRDADIASGTADSVRKYTAADDGANTATECRADDPRPAIARECTAALKLLDDYARGLARQSAGLQDFAANVCVKQALAQ